MKAKRIFKVQFLLTLPALAVIAAQSQTPGTPTLTGADLDQKIATVAPTTEEQAYLEIPWRLNIMQARLEAMRTGKPMFVWEMNGHPLGHT